MNMTPSVGNGSSSPFSLDGLRQSVQGLLSPAAGTSTSSSSSSSPSILNFDQYQLPGQGLGSSADFLSLNGIVAKIAFFVLVILMFIFLFRVFSTLIVQAYRPSGQVQLFNGMFDGTSINSFSQDPNDPKSKIILRSTNQEGGIEFTWGCWLYVKSDSTGVKNVFYKGQEEHPCPRVFIQPVGGDANTPSTTYSLSVELDTFKNNTGTNKETVIVQHIPVQNWFYLTIRQQNNNMDVYVNGNIVKRAKLNGVPRQNYGNVIIGKSGFSGYISNLYYWNRSLSPAEIESMVSYGPNTNPLAAAGPQDKKPGSTDYLAFSWFLGPTSNVIA